MGDAPRHRRSRPLTPRAPAHSPPGSHTTRSPAPRIRRSAARSGYWGARRTPRSGRCRHRGLALAARKPGRGRRHRPDRRSARARAQRPAPARWACASTASACRPLEMPWPGLSRRLPAAGGVPARADGDRVLLAARSRRARGDLWARLGRDLGCTPVYVRYNSGRHISHNGRDLADLLAAIADSWPVESPRSRWSVTPWAVWSPAAPAIQAAQRGTLGAPRPPRRDARDAAHGRAARAGGALASAALHAVPETRPFGAFLRRRSAGIRDLRQGSLVDEDWRGRDPDALRARLPGDPAARRRDALLRGGDHHAQPRHPLGRLIGDCLVLEPSASGRSRSRTIPFRSSTACTSGAPPLRPAQPPAGLRAAARLAGRVARAGGRRRLSRRGQARPQRGRDLSIALRVRGRSPLRA